jgi:hypothetical protein
MLGYISQVSLARSLYELSEHFSHGSLSVRDKCVISLSQNVMMMAF